MTYGVVVVDDAEDLRTLIRLALRRDGRLEVLAEAGDGQQGIDAVDTVHPDVVLMDVAMPVLDGLSATRQLKRSHPEVPILVFTGYGDGRVAAEATEAGADAFLDKSTPLHVVVEMLVELAARS